MKHTEEFKIAGEDIVRTVKKLIAEGNIRRIIIKNDEGKTIIEIPLTFGVVGALLLPTIAALGTIAALVTKCTLVVEREEKDDVTGGAENAATTEVE